MAYLASTTVLIYLSLYCLGVAVHDRCYSHLVYGAVVAIGVAVNVWWALERLDICVMVK